MNAISRLPAWQGEPGASCGKVSGASVGQQFADGGGQMAGLRKNLVFQLGMIRAEGVHRRNAPHRRVKLIEEMIKGSKLDLPEALVNYETELMLDELKTSLSRSNLTLESYLHGVKKSEDEIKADLKHPAVQRAKGKVILKKISEAEGITVVSQDIDQEIRLMAASAGQPEEEYKGTLGEGGLHYIKDYLLRKKALDYVVENAQIKEEKQ